MASASESHEQPDAARLDSVDVVEVCEESELSVVEPFRRPSFDLHELVAGITNENLHEEIDFGPPVGNEVW